MHNLIRYFIIAVFMATLAMPASAQQDSRPDKPDTSGEAYHQGVIDANEPMQATPPQRRPSRHNDASESAIRRPLIERYILDELKSLRSDYLTLEAKIERKIAETRLDVSDRALRYSADTMNNIFIAITISASILVLVGLNSLRDIKMKTEDMVNSRIEEITQEYRKRLYDVEEALRRRTEEIIVAQEEIAKTNEAHSLWMRVGLEPNVQQKIEIYDEILKINRDDAEAYAYKADAVLELGESEWAINLCNKAIDVDPDYGYAYWQLACAHAVLGNQQYAMENLKTAIEKSPQLALDIETEPSFESLRELESYKELVVTG